MRRTKLNSILCLAILCSATAVSQTSGLSSVQPVMFAYSASPDLPAIGSSTRPEPNYTLTKDVRTVRLDFSVRDQSGRVVSQLAKSSFSVWDGGSEVSDILQFRSYANMKLSIGILIDTSRSTEKQLAAEKQVALEFLNHHLLAGDTAMIASFSTKLGVVQPFTSDPVALTRAVQQMKASGLTGFNDAIVESCERYLSSAPKDTRKILVIVSDGDDTVSQYSHNDALTALLKNDIITYTIKNSRDLGTWGDHTLALLSASTGGRSYWSKTPKDLKSFFDEVDSDLRSSYSVEYRVPESKSDSHFHPVAIKLTAGGFNVRTREGYFTEN